MVLYRGWGAADSLALVGSSGNNAYCRTVEYDDPFREAT